MNKRGVALMSGAHAVDDLYQGAVPALLPFLVAERHYTYAAVAGLTLAATVLSSVAQPLFGWWTDRGARRWMIGVGMSMAALGVALSGLTTSYELTWIVIACSGLGIAAFHPEAARAARQAAGDSNRAMSVFALGGNAGFALGAVITTPLLMAAGVSATVFLALPALVMVGILAARLRVVLDGPAGHPTPDTLPTGEDDWSAFLRLTLVVVARSMLFFGLTSFLALYFIDDLGGSATEGGVALTVFLVSGSVGTLLGGWVADRFGRVLSIRLGLALTAPAIAGLVMTTNRPVALVFVVLTGIAVFMPFSVLVMLGQDYLPNRIGTASGVTVGLAVSVGGLATPVLGRLADLTSLRTSLSVLIVLPLVALALSVLIHEPAPRTADSEQLAV
ncbi:MAG TPA: MFS transporter [Actinomycetes bacterium]|nr:MFS transporter [Actinomycetes bacterium]